MIEKLINENNLSNAERSAVNLKIPAKLGEKLEKDGVFTAELDSIIAPIYLEWDILGSRYEAIIELLIESPTNYTYTGYPLFDQANAKIAKLRSENKLLSDQDLLAKIQSSLDEIRQEQNLVEDTRTLQQVLRSSLWSHIDRSDDIPRRSQQNRELVKEHSRQLMFRRIEQDRDLHSREMREASQKAVQIRQEKSSQYLQQIVPKIQELASEGLDYENIAQKLNHDGQTTRMGNPFTRSIIESIAHKSGILFGKNRQSKESEAFSAEIIPLIRNLKGKTENGAEKTYAEVAQILNNDGYLTPTGKEFTEDTVRYFDTNTKGFVSETLIQEQKVQEIEQELDKLFWLLPAESILETQKIVLKIKSLRNSISNSRFLDRYSDHPNYSFLHSSLSWKGQLYLPALAEAKQQIVEWQEFEKVVDLDSVSSLGDVAVAMISTHPDNGEVRKTNVYQDVADTLRVIFEILNHPYSEFLTTSVLRNFIKIEGKTDVLTEPNIIKKSVYKPTSSTSEGSQDSNIQITTEEIQTLLEEQVNGEYIKIDNVAQRLNQKYSTQINTDQLRAYMNSVGIKYTRMEDFWEKIELENNDFLELIAETETARQELINSPALKQLADSYDWQNEQKFLSNDDYQKLLDISNISKVVREDDKRHQRVQKTYGSANASLELALETGVLPTPNLAIDVGDRYRNDLYFHFPEIVWQWIAETYGIEPLGFAVEEKTGTRVGIMNVGDFNIEMATFIARDTRENFQIFRNFGDFFTLINDELTRIFVRAAHPFAFALTRANLLVSFSRNARDGSEAHKEVLASVLTSQQIWEIPVWISDGIQLNFNDLLVKVIKDSAVVWSTLSNDDRRKKILTEVENYFKDADGVTQVWMTLEYFKELFENKEFQNKLVTKLKNLRS